MYLWSIMLSCVLSHSCPIYTDSPNILLPLLVLRLLMLLPVRHWCSITVAPEQLFRRIASGNISLSLYPEAYEQFVFVHSYNNSNTVLSSERFHSKLLFILDFNLIRSTSTVYLIQTIAISDFPALRSIYLLLYEIPRKCNSFKALLSPSQRSTKILDKRVVRQLNTYVNCISKNGGYQMLIKKSTSFHNSRQVSINIFIKNMKYLK